MLLPLGGVDVWYIDESSDANFVAVSAISVPFLRPEDGTWHLVWEDHFNAVRVYRRRLRQVHGIPVRKELHAVKLASGRGAYRGRHQPRFHKRAAAGVYLWTLSNLTFLQPSSIISVVGGPNARLYGHTRLEAAMYALFQRMQRQSTAMARAGFTFFDEGHGEFRKLYRRARIHLPTGSSEGGWPSGQYSINIPMGHFVKDGNTQDSAHSWFIQVADLIAYAALLKVKAHHHALTSWQSSTGNGTGADRREKERFLRSARPMLNERQAAPRQRRFLAPALVVPTLASRCRMPARQRTASGSVDRRRATIGEPSVLTPGPRPVGHPTTPLAFVRVSVPPPALWKS